MRRTRAWLALAALAPLLASCWWLEAEPGPGEWRQRSGTRGDFQPHHSATLFEANASGQLLMECGEGPITLSIAPARDPIDGDTIRVPVRYRLDSAAPVGVEAPTIGNYLWFSDPQTATGEDPMVRRIAGARQLVVRIDWSAQDRQTMRFDVSRAGPAIDWLRGQCATAAARKR